MRNVAYGKARAMFFGALLALICIGLNSRVNAAPLAAGQTAVAAGEADPLGGVLIANSGPVPMVAPTFSGTLTSQVIANDPGNPFGPGFLTFTYALTNNALSPDPIERITVSSFTGFQTDVSYQVPTAAVAPSLMNRTANSSVVGFSYVGAPLGAGVIVPGGASALMVVQTDAPINQFILSTASVINGSVATVDAFAPLPNIPEPGSLGLLGCAALLTIRRRST